MQTNKKIIYWLYSCCAAIFLMVMIGGLTRLTDSGLSIMVWEPLKGTLPPLSEAGWQYYFEEYKKIPEFSQINSYFGMAEFKEIFWLEYIHRVWGRFIGILFAVPFLYFLFTKQLNKKLALRLAGIFALGSMQGFVGWFMVASGFGNRVDVSQYRLAIHLLLAVTIYALILWTALNIAYPRKSKKSNLLTNYSRGIIALIFFMIFLGALMAGTHAGLTYNTFPLMDGKIIPNGLYSLSPWWINHFENITMIQFQHRLFAILLAIDIMIFGAFLIKQKPKMRQYAIALIVVLLVQIGLGISTLYSFAELGNYFEVKGFKRVFYTPVILAVLHQINAVVMVTVNLIILHKLLRKS